MCSGSSVSEPQPQHGKNQKTATVVRWSIDTIYGWTKQHGMVRVFKCSNTSGACLPAVWMALFLLLVGPWVSETSCIYSCAFTCASINGLDHTLDCTPRSLISHPLALSAHAAIPRGNLPSHTVPPTVAPPQPEADHTFPWVPMEEDSFPFDELQLMPPPRGMRRGRGVSHTHTISWQGVKLRIK